MMSVLESILDAIVESHIELQARVIPAYVGGPSQKFNNILIDVFRVLHYQYLELSFGYSSHEGVPKHAFQAINKEFPTPSHRIRKGLEQDWPNPISGTLCEVGYSIVDPREAIREGDWFSSKYQNTGGYKLLYLGNIMPHEGLRIRGM